MSLGKGGESCQDNVNQPLITQLYSESLVKIAEGCVAQIKPDSVLGGRQEVCIGGIGSVKSLSWQPVLFEP